MGKKGKTGQHRKDKFYKLAKETGYRARSAFKLIQLNRKYGFLQKSKVLVDLCAAPGGWLQVAAKYMPVSSLLVGIDLVSIKPIPNVTTIQADITTDKCRQALRKELATWHADCVLHDGAPNVGSNWLKDASEQAQLVLAALKLATEVLSKGGCFVTKVFRSRDYHALLWVFQQLFKMVHATKPQASRHESAEIFVVCEGFIAPDKIDPRFLDPRFAFKEVDVVQTTQVNLKTLEQKKAKAEGYADGDLTLFHKAKVSEFISSDTYMDMLASKNQLFFDDERIANHPLTTSEIKLCCQDIKLLGRKDIRLLLRWRKKMKEMLQSSTDTDQSTPQTGAEEEEEEDVKIDEHLSQLQQEEAAQLKRKKKEVQKERRKLQERMVLKMDVLNDKHDFQEERPLFNLQRIQKKQELAGVKGDAHLNTALDDIGSESESDEEPEPLIQRDPDLNSEPDSDDLEIAKADQLQYEADQPSTSAAAVDDDYDIGGVDVELKNPLLVDLESADTDRRVLMRTDRWFSKDIFAGVTSDDDDDLEDVDQKDDNDTITDEGVQEEESPVEKHSSEREMTGGDSDTDASDSEASDYDVDETIGKSAQTTAVQAPVNKPRRDGFEVVPENDERTKRKLDPEGLALGALISTSKKRKRDIIDWAFNRYTFDDDGLPDWFVKEEGKHSKKQLPVTKDMVTEYREKLKAINARPVKKVAEAKARKKRKTLKRMEKAKKRAEAITESGDMSDKEKVQQIKQLYKKAGAVGKKKPEKTYVVARKFNAAKRPKRPAGLKGPYRVVDPRMKKDARKNNSKQSGNKRGKKR